MNIVSTAALILYLCLCLVLFQSCKSSREITYFQNLDVNKTDSLIGKKMHKIASGDILQINVVTMNDDADRPFTKGGFIASNYPTPGYMVDSIGCIELPYLGSSLIKGMTTSEAGIMLKEKLSPFLKDPIISIKLMNFNIAVLGDVAKPGTFQITNERVSLPEALSLAGDLTITARRDNVILIREKNGLRTYARINLKKTDFFASPFYYLESNDIIYVEPSKAKIAQADTKTWQLLTFIVTSLSLITVLVLRVK